MHDLIESRRDDIAQLCRRFHVHRLELFGSAARETDFDAESSDVDLLIDYEPEHAPPSLSEYPALRDALATMFARPVDLLMSSCVRNPFVREHINRSRKTIYAP
ncbi:MAG: nucleotidyltransferase domain-containing protein [Rhodospirillales bacterium]|nr:nucleotidyltransferase domain-containing protein [Rhodospirillales bacterium]